MATYAISIGVFGGARQTRQGSCDSTGTQAADAAQRRSASRNSLGETVRERLPILSGRIGLTSNTDTPKSGKGEVEMIRMLKSAKNSAVMARTQAVNQMKALVLTAPAELRETLDGLANSALIKRCRSFRPGRPRNPMAAAKYALRSLACRYSQLSKEIHDLRAELQQLIQATAPALVEAFGVGPDTAAALLIAAGSNSDRLHSEAAFASLCGVSPISASSGKTNRHRLNRGGDRQANAALYRVVVVRLCHDLRTQAYLRRRTAEGMSKIEVIRCLKRYVAREVYSIIRKPNQILDKAA